VIVCGSFVAFVACGKKGPPLAPIVRIPSAVAMIHAQRIGSDAFVTLAIPNTNIDRSVPIDIGRVEVYGYTGRRPPPPTRFVEFGDLVASIPVIPPPPPGAAPAEQTPIDPSKGALPGTMVTVLDRLSGQKLLQGKVEEAPARGSRTPTPAVAAATPEPDVLHRFYIAVAFSARGRNGPPGANTDFPLIETPEPPAFVSAPYSETMVALEWPPSGGILGFLFNSALPPEEPPLNDLFEPIVQPPATPVGAQVAVPTGPVKYNVYRELEPDPFAPPDAGRLPWTETLPMPINAAPLDAMTLSDSVEFNRERCYIVRAVRGTPPNAVEGDASMSNCFIPVDVFPPAAPARLVAVADEGGISLIWEPNAEPDVAGYLVLRGEPTDARLQPLTPTPVTEARFRDTHVSTGKKYVYAVVALDSRLPFGNISAESDRVEETAR